MNSLLSNGIKTELDVAEPERCLGDILIHIYIYQINALMSHVNPDALWILHLLSGVVA